MKENLPRVGILSGEGEGIDRPPFFPDDHRPIHRGIRWDPSRNLAVNEKEKRRGIRSRRSNESIGNGEGIGENGEKSRAGG